MITQTHALPTNYARAGVQFRTICPDQLTEEQIAGWRELATASLDANIFLDPDYILPALRHLGPQDARVIMVEAEEHDNLLAVGIFTEEGPDRRFPFRHLRTFAGAHSFLSGVLLRADAADRAAEGLMRGLRAQQSVRGVRFEQTRAKGATFAALRAAAPRIGLGWHELGRTERAVLEMSARRGQDPEEYLSRSRRKSWRKGCRRLEEWGEVTWRCLSGDSVTSAVTERFLAIEHAGWKGEAGTSLLSDPAHAAFYREVTNRLAPRSNIFYTELAAGGRVVAMTSNLMQGGSGFALKVAWDEEFKAAAPGILNEIFFLHEMPDLGIETLDSGAAPGSFVEDLWPDRTSLVTGVFAMGTAANVVSHLVQGGRYVKRRLDRWRRHDDA